MWSDTIYVAQLHFQWAFSLVLPPYSLEVARQLFNATRKPEGAHPPMKRANPRQRLYEFPTQCVFCNSKTDLFWRSSGHRQLLGITRGRTSRESVRDHIVTWNSSFKLEATITVGKDGVLLPCDMLFEVKQEVNGAKTAEDVGLVRVNLSEFAGLRGQTRRFLLQDSKVNSTIKITVDMMQIRGDPVFKVPPPTHTNVISLRGILAEGSAERTMQVELDDSMQIQTRSLDRGGTMSRTLSMYQTADDQAIMDEIFKEASSEVHASNEIS
ncbi:hypothetical protein SeMB42_g06018 [Synchytrium endobioticum]|uniref:C2 NT-type domain-containing protein n=1 Tax=Synchytrium endobioticum TaxID=286115 RepID=A0A507CMY1_9FUNG|nr:hypothetical protein SeMB42_g06016 [Synchytrium endobioticum]TPX40423.1 hypothetical protein SeMB42_g06018 [Synchytrium endobioticum]